MDKQEVFSKVIEEVDKARMMYPAFRSEHEAIAVIREEYLELEEQVFEKQRWYNKERQTKEATHLAAMAVRFMIDLI